MDEKEIKEVSIVPKADVEGAIQSLNSFLDLKKRILGKDDTVSISGKQYIKRSGWRKISLAFNITTEIVSIDREYRDNVYIVRVKARAVAPNGRISEEIGVCDSSEFATGKLKGTVHNIETKASTRAINRAISNLVGGGEVSAEEIIIGPDEDEKPSSSPKPESPPSEKKEDITPKQKSTLINMMASDDRKKDWVEFQLVRLKKENIQLLTKSEASEILEVVLSADFPEKSNTSEFKAYLDQRYHQ